MLTLWVKTLGRSFFAQHAGMFLFIFYMIFGAVEPAQMLSYNLTLLLAISSSTIVTCVFCFILLLYALKSLAFVRLKTALPAYHFIKTSGASAKNAQLKSWLGLYLVLFSPLLIYILFIICIGLYHHYFWNIAGLILWCTLLFTTLVWISYRRVNYAFIRPIRVINIDLPAVNKPYGTWKMFYLIKQQTIMLITCKILSLFLFKGIVWMFGEADDNIKVYFIALLAAVLSHSVLIVTVLRFEKTQLAFTYSLPIGNWKRLLNLFAFFLVLFIPELLIYFNMVRFSPADLLTGIGFCLGCLGIFHFSIYVFGDDMDKYFRFIFAFFITVLLVILYNQVLIFSLLLLIITTSYHHYLCYKSRL